MKDLRELVKDVERDLVINMAISVEHKRITFDESKKIAKDYLSYAPFKNYEDLFERLYFLSNSYREIRKIYVKYSPRFYQEKSEETLTAMRMFMNKNNYDVAVKIAKGIYAKK